jgi:DNA gyrase inhibitor GyrI
MEGQEKDAKDVFQFLTQYRTTTRMKAETVLSCLTWLGVGHDEPDPNPVAVKEAKAVYGHWQSINRK